MTGRSQYGVITCHTFKWHVAT